MSSTIRMEEIMVIVTPGIKVQGISVVYIDQLSGAAHRKLVKALFWPFFHLFVDFKSFSVIIH